MLTTEDEVQDFGALGDVPLVRRRLQGEVPHLATDVHHLGLAGAVGEV